MEEELRRNQARRAPLDVPRDVGGEDDDDGEEEGEGEGGENAEEDDEDPFDLPPPLMEPRGRRAELEAAAERVRFEEEDEEDDGFGLRDDEMEAQNDRMMEEDLDGILEGLFLSSFRSECSEVCRVALTDSSCLFGLLSNSHRSSRSYLATSTELGPDDAYSFDLRCGHDLPSIYDRKGELPFLLDLPFRLDLL